jgi:hypothetical protein
VRRAVGVVVARNERAHAAKHAKEARRACPLAPSACAAPVPPPLRTRLPLSPRSQPRRAGHGRRRSARETRRTHCAGRCWVRRSRGGVTGGTRSTSLPSLIGFCCNSYSHAAAVEATRAAEAARAAAERRLEQVRAMMAWISAAAVSSRGLSEGLAVVFAGTEGPPPPSPRGTTWMALTSWLVCLGPPISLPAIPTAATTPAAVGGGAGLGAAARHAARGRQRCSSGADVGAAGDTRGGARGDGAARRGAGR